MNYLSFFNVTQYSLNSKVAIISAFFYCLAFIDLEQLFWCIIPALFFLVCSIYACDSVSEAIKKALQWGCIVYGLHCACIAYSLFIVRPHYGLGALWAFATLYLASYTVVLFVLCAGARLLCSKRIIAWSLIAGCIVTYFWVIECHAFWIFGARGGCCLVSPLIPLSRFFVSDLDPTPAYIGIVRTPYVPGQEVDPAAWVRNFFKLVAHEREKNSAVACIVTPESALPFALNKHRTLIKMFCNYSLMLPLLVGAFFEDSHGVHNCFYYFQQGDLAFLYKKEHHMPYIEMMPGWCKHGTQKSRVPDRMCLPAFSLYPIICSELFCDAFMSRVPDGNSALVLVNDAWFAFSFLKECAFAYAQVQAWWHGKKIVYVSFFKNGCF